MKSFLKSWAYPLLLLVSLGLPALPASASLDNGVLMLTFNHAFGEASSKLTIGYQQLESVDRNAYSGFNLSADLTLDRQDLHLESFRFGLFNSDWHYESDIGLKFIARENQWHLNSRISDDLYSLNVDLAPSGLLDGNPEEMIVNISKSRIARKIADDIIKKAKKRGLTTPNKYFESKTRQELKDDLEKKYGPPKSTREYADTYHNDKTKRSYNVHEEPGHNDGKPHVDIRRRGGYEERKYNLKEGG